FAGGLSFSEHGAKATGMANAFSGQADDPSAIFYNPAGITQLPGTQVMAGTAIVHLNSVCRSSTTGESAQLQDQFPLVPHLYITHRFKQWDERLSIGLGITTPFGIVVDWPDNWKGRFDSTDAKLRVTIYNPVVAFQATKKLSVAAGVRVADVAAEFEQKFNIGNGESKVRGYGLTAHPVGWNVGLLYRVTDTAAVGLSVRSELQAKLRGQADLNGAGASGLGSANGFATAGFQSNIKLPPQVVGGLSTKIFPRWTINADIEWEGWQTLGSLPRDYVGSTVLDSVSRRLWKNSWVYRLGAEYAATDRVSLRGGIFYDETPIPDNTFDANIPNANLYAVTTGFGYKGNAATLDLGYLIGFYEKRAIDNSTLDPNNKGGSLGLGPTAFGSYSTTAQVLTVSVTFK
ncbi:MAG: outer membrane protein transport protein, partial [Phycisphaerales bacterium]|nr:outer membrane protein transport protein [Phycisphaerales bacterium]